MTGISIRSTRAEHVPNLKTIEYGVTHEVVIDGDKAWIRFGVTADADLATPEQVIEFVNAKVLEAAQKAADSVRGFTETQHTQINP